MTNRHTSGEESAIPPHDRILLSEAVAAELCSVSQVTFRKWVQSGLIERVELPGGLRRNLYRRVDIEAFVERLGHAQSK